MRRYREMDTDNLPAGLAQDFAVLGRAIAVMPDTPPPADFLAGVMGRLAPKRAPWWRRALIRFAAPSLNLSPLQVVPAGVAAAAVLLACLFWGYGPKPAAPLAGISVRPDLAQVVFTLNMPQAGNVALVGNFNDWSPAGYEMHRDGRTGQWTITVPLGSGRHEYSFLVDYERMMPDPGAVIRHADGFGNMNSVLVIDKKHAHTTQARSSSGRPRVALPPAGDDSPGGRGQPVRDGAHRPGRGVARRAGPAHHGPGLPVRPDRRRDGRFHRHPDRGRVRRTARGRPGRQDRRRPGQACRSQGRGPGGQPAGRPLPLRALPGECHAQALGPGRDGPHRVRPRGPGLAAQRGPGRGPDAPGHGALPQGHTRRVGREPRISGRDP